MFGKKSSAKKTSSAAKSTTKKPAAKKPASKTTKSVSKTQTQELAEYIRQKQTPEPEFQYIANEDHYDKVIEKIKDCKKTLWIGTADIKDLYVKEGRGTKPLLEVLSDLPGVQLYTGNFMDGEPGKDGIGLDKNFGFCLETQYYPDTPNRPEFPQCTFKKGEKFKSLTVFKV